MKKIIILLISLGLFISSCDKPDIFDKDAKLKIENTSTSNYITGVYYGTVGPGSNNKLSKNIGPGESITFTISTKDDNIYDIKITSDMVGHEEFIETHYDFGWNETYIIELTESGWYTDSTW